MRITDIVLAAAGVAGLVGMAGCSGENLFALSDVSLVDRLADFQAVRFELVSEDGDTLDLIVDGARFQLALDEDEGTFESDFQHDDIGARIEGTFELDGEHIILSDDPFAEDDATIERRFEFDDAGDVIFLRDPSAAWDIDDDGQNEVVELEIRMERDG